MDLETGKAELAKLGIFPSVKVVSADPVRRRGALIGTIKNPSVSGVVRERAVAELKELIKRYPELDKLSITVVTEDSTVTETDNLTV